MTTDDDMREIEAALDGYENAARTYRNDDEFKRSQKMRGDLLALIRQKLPKTDAEHERAVEAWILSVFGPSGVAVLGQNGVARITAGDIDEALRLMRARTVDDKAADLERYGPAPTMHAMEPSPEWLGELLRAAKDAANWLLECDQDGDAQKLYAAIEAAARSGVR